MKKIIFLSFILLLSACSNGEEKHQAKYGVICIDGLLFAEYRGDYGTNFIQVYEPAQSPENPPQPKTCKTKGVE